MKISSFGYLVLLIGLSVSLSRSVAAQSSDQNLPTPIGSAEVVGRIRPLDLGDPRLTRRFYAFEGTPGDLILTVNTLNLNGDLDVFTAVTFRPLMKVTFYASSRPQPITKSVFLHSREVLILRVEARTPNDDEGTYRVNFSGAFEPFSGGIPVAENSESTEDSGGAGGRRLSSAGARIDEPVTEPTPKPVEKSADETTGATSPAKSAKSTPAKRVTRRRGTRTVRNKTAPKSPPKSEPAKTEEAKTETSAAKPEAVSSKPEKPAETEKPPQEITPPAGAHLIIEEKDGTRIDRPMTTVRRVVIDGGSIVIVLKTGRIERIQMSNVLRMSIEP